VARRLTDHDAKFMLRTPPVSDYTY
jgi:hypothetical protein